MSMCKREALSASRGRSNRWSSKKVLNNSLLKSSIWSPEKGCRGMDTELVVSFSAATLFSFQGESLWMKLNRVTHWGLRFSLRLLLKQHVRLLQDIISSNLEDALQPISIFSLINKIRQSFLHFFKHFVSVQNPVFSSAEAGRKTEKKKNQHSFCFKKKKWQFDLFFSQPTDQMFCLIVSNLSGARRRTDRFIFSLDGWVTALTDDVLEAWDSMVLWFPGFTHIHTHTQVLSKHAEGAAKSHQRAHAFAGGEITFNNNNTHFIY